jgi:hypothetical protein
MKKKGRAVCIRRNEEGRKSCILERMKKEGRAVY